MPLNIPAISLLTHSNQVRSSSLTS